MKKTVFTIGRHGSCDCKIRNVYSSVSRLQVIGLCAEHVRSKDRVYILIDSWSFAGTRVQVKIDDTQLQYQSIPNHRDYIIVPAQYPMTLELGIKTAGGVTVIPLQCHLNIRLCVICMDKPRSYRLGCNHCVSCADCTESMYERGMMCPICRAPIERTKTRPVTTLAETNTCCIDNDESYNVGLASRMHQLTVMSRSVLSDTHLHAETLECSICKQSKSRNHFSNRQWKHRVHHKCKECIQIV